MIKQIQNLPVVHLAAFAEIEEKRPVLLVTWRAVQGQLHLPIVAQCAVARPMPEPAPVIKATLFANSIEPHFRTYK
jgi:hypothetical protein